MDDAGLNECIDHHAETAESHLPRQARFQNDQAHLEPSRWWFASSAFPMIAGTLGPVASAFSICALVRPWRQHLAPGANIQYAPFISDPAWLTAINVIQLVIALVANVFLLLNMARRVRFSIAQPITIVGWYISTILLISLNATAGGPLKKGLHPVDEYVWSQAFYYGIYAAILYFVDASLMVVTFWGASAGHYSRDFALTASQRTLMLQTIMFLIYLLLGALVFSNLEDWNYLDAVYWANVTLFTIGFGDYSMSTTLGRGLLFPYALVGIISLGLVIGSIRSLVLERGKRRMNARMEEKQRRQLVRSMTLKGNDAVFKPLDADSDISPISQDPNQPATEFERRKAEFELMRRVQAKAVSRRQWMAMAVSTGTWAVLWLVGAAIFLACESPYQTFSYFDGVYFCFVSFTTIGYGDVTPVSNAGKSFFVFWSLLALPTVTVLISNAGDTVVKFVRDATIILGNITILPGDDGIYRTVKHIVSKLTFGRLFPDFHMRPTIPKIRASEYIEHVDGAADLDDAADVLGQGRRASGRDGTAHRGRRNLLDAEQGDARLRRDNSSGAPSTFTSRVRRSLSRLRDPLDNLPSGTDFQFLLIAEIQVVTKHLRESTPHRYSYEEWAWYLRLIGEDERSPATHRKALPKDKKKHPTNVPTNDEIDHFKWSWVGNRSPLMGSQEESEWILDRLTERLKEVLSIEGRYHKKLISNFFNRTTRPKQTNDADDEKHQGEQ